MQTQATEQRNMSTQTDAPPQSQSNTLSTPRSFSQNALRSGNLDAGKFIVLQLTAFRFSVLGAKLEVLRRFTSLVVQHRP